MLTPGTKLGPYEVVSSLGAGGMGEVYRARDSRLGRDVAIKILPAEGQDRAELRLRFEREAQTISQLNHPHICLLHDVGEATIEGTADGESAGTTTVSYIVMECLEGETLADRLTRGPLPVDQVLRLGIQIADALEAAHRRGIVHRDLKPGNVMVTKAGAKLLDFGLARHSDTSPLQIGDESLLNSPTAVRPLTTEGAIVGTFQYMAPEQIEGATADARTDIFGLGCVLYEMVTGQRAFQGSSKGSLIAAIVSGTPEPVSSIQPMSPHGLERVILECLQKDPDDRWQSAHDIKRELEWIRDGLSSGGTALDAPTRRRSRVREWLAWTVAAIFALAAVTALWSSYVHAEGEVTEPPLVSAIAPPTGSELIVTGDAGGPVTVSPDGQHVTYVAKDEQGPRLWVQSLRTGEAEPLPGTAGGMFPFWSPDSRSIGFFNSGKLQVIELDGAAPRAIAEAPDARGGSWASDGTIIYAPFTQAGIWKVAAVGGEAAEIVKLAPPYSTYRWPAFLPDGRTFVYLAASHADPSSPDTAVYLASVDGSENRRLLQNLGSAIPYGDHLLFLQGLQLQAQRLSEGELVGERFSIRDNVLYDPGTWRMLASVSTNGLLVVQPTGGKLGSRLLWFDRNGTVVDEIEPQDTYTDIAVSPDGKTVVMGIGDPHSQLYLYDVERRVKSRFSFIDGGAAYPLWTPDGKQVIFSGFLADGRSGLWIKPVDGSLSERLFFEDPTVVRPTDVSPDGSLVLYDSQLSGGGDILALPLDGGEPFPVVSDPGQQIDGHFSPDGKWLTYVSSWAGGRSVFLRPFPGPGGKWQISGETAAIFAWWNSNGREILYFTADGSLNAVSVSLEGSGVQLGDPVQLLNILVNTNSRTIGTMQDGSRFLIRVSADESSGAATLIQNWDAKLR